MMVDNLLLFKKQEIDLLGGELGPAFVIAVF